MRLNELTDNVNATKARKRVGRGIGSGTGKTSTRGQKGQRSRSGGNVPVGFEGGQMPLYRRLPKRGFYNPFRKDFAIINVGAIQAAVDKGVIDPKSAVTSEVLLSSGLVRKNRDGVRLLAKGKVSDKLEISVTAASKAAVAAVESAGGSVILPEPKPKPEGKGKSRHRKMKEREAEITKAGGDDGE